MLILNPVAQKVLDRRCQPVYSSQPEPSMWHAFRPDVITDLDEETAEEKAAGEKDDPSFFQRRAGEGAEEYARRVFQRVFCNDIQRVLRMDVSSLAAIDMPTNAHHRPDEYPVCNRHANVPTSGFFQTQTPPDDSSQPDGCSTTCCHTQALDFICTQDLWKTRSRPTPLDAAELLDTEVDVPIASDADGTASMHGPAANGTEAAAARGCASRAQGLTEVHKLWSLQVRSCRWHCAANAANAASIMAASTNSPAS